MQFSIRSDGSSRVAELSGRMTFHDHKEFRDMLGQLIEGGVQSYVFDLAKVEHVDSSGLGMLLLARDNAENAGTTNVVLRNAPEAVRHTLRLAKFEELFDIQD